MPIRRMRVAHPGEVASAPARIQQCNPRGVCSPPANARGVDRQNQSRVRSLREHALHTVGPWRRCATSPVEQLPSRHRTLPDDRDRSRAQTRESISVSFMKR